MMDKTIPYIGIIMTNLSPDDYPRFPIPDGYTLREYEPTMAKDWAKLTVRVEEFDSIQAANERFRWEMAPDPDTLKRRGVFIYAPDGTLAATALLWYGDLFGYTQARVHWVAVDPEHQGRGLCKAVMTRLMDLYRHDGLQGGIYLTSQTWSYKAINIYRRFGFVPYNSSCPATWTPSTGSFELETREAWRLIEDKLHAYRQRR